MKIKIRETTKSKKDWSLFQLANELEMPQQTIYSWANGRTQPNYKNMDKLCQILECKMDDLFEAEKVDLEVF